MENGKTENGQKLIQIASTVNKIVYQLIRFSGNSLFHLAAQMNSA